MLTGGRGARRPGLPCLAAALAAALAGAGCAGARPAAQDLPRWAVLRGDDAFRRRLIDALARLRRTRAGALVQSRLAATGKTVVFNPIAMPGSFAVGGEADAAVWWNPDFGAPETPAFVSLHHELVHASQRLASAVDVGTRLEDEAVGLGEFASSPVCENALRRELGLPQRASHDSLPGFSEEEYAERVLAAYRAQEKSLKEAPPPDPGSIFPKVDATIPSWVEEEEKR